MSEQRQKIQLELAYLARARVKPGRRCGEGPNR